MYTALISVILWVAACGIALFDIVLGFVLAYHWTKYAMNRVVTITAIVLYIIVSIILLFAIFGATASYTFML